MLSTVQVYGYENYNAEVQYTAKSETCVKRTFNVPLTYSNRIN